MGMKWQSRKYKKWYLTLKTLKILLGNLLLQKLPRIYTYIPWTKESQLLDPAQGIERNPQNLCNLIFYLRGLEELHSHTYFNRFLLYSLNVVLVMFFVTFSAFSISHSSSFFTLDVPLLVLSNTMLSFSHDASQVSAQLSFSSFRLQRPHNLSGCTSEGHRPPLK